MINANELRIGNILSCDLSSATVIGVSLTKIEIAVYGKIVEIDIANQVDYQQATSRFFRDEPSISNPIDYMEINQKWLVDFGFEQKSILGYSKSGIIYIKSPLIINPIPDNAFDVWLNKGEGEHSLFLSMRYIHQLQNFFYSLTGTELSLQR